MLRIYNRRGWIPPLWLWRATLVLASPAVAYLTVRRMRKTGNVRASIAHTLQVWRDGWSGAFFNPNPPRS